MSALGTVVLAVRVCVAASGAATMARLHLPETLAGRPALLDDSQGRP
ncbi:hypothetical protein [Streptomyces sp. NPDC001410]